MVTMPKTVAQRMNSMEPSRADLVWWVFRERLGTREGSKRKPSLVSAKISPRKVRGGEVLAAGDREAGSARQGVLILLIA